MRAVADQCMVHECAQIVGAAVGGAVLLLAVGVGVAVAVCAAKKKSKSRKLIRPNSPSAEGNEEDDSDDDITEGNTTQRRASVTKVVIERSCSNHSVLVCDLRTGSAVLSICDYLHL